MGSESSVSQERSFPYLDDLRRAYDGDAGARNAIDDLQWRTGALETWLHELPPAARLLELGPGTGQLAAYAATLGARVQAIDLSARNVEYCRQRGVAAQVGDFRTLGQIEGLDLFDRELVPTNSTNGLSPQLLDLRRVPIQG